MNKGFMGKLTDATISVDEKGIAHLTLIATGVHQKLVVFADFTEICFTNSWEIEHNDYRYNNNSDSQKYYVKRDFSLPLANVRATMEELSPPELTQQEIEEMLGFKVKIISEKKEKDK